MKKFDYMEKFEHEQLVFFQDKETGLRAITCIHNTVLGPALGGTRLWNYASEEEAVEDCLRLARGMTYKNSMAGLPLGGGKSVIIGDVKEIRSNSVRREAFWRTFARFINGLGGRYITAEDMNTTCLDMDFIHMETKYVVGLQGRSGNPSPYTARGVYKSMLACCKHVYGTDSVAGRTVAIQGMGAVARVLAEYLHKDGANLIFSQLDDEKAAKTVADFGAKRVSVDDIYSVDCDIFSPNAMGAIINDNTIPQLKCKIICGGANNILKDAPIHGKALKDRGIVCAPDYVVNAGGVINVSHEFADCGYKEASSISDIDKLYDRILEVLRIADKTGRPTHEVADQMAEARIAAVKKTKGIRC